MAACGTCLQSVLGAPRTIGSGGSSDSPQGPGSISLCGRVPTAAYASYLQTSLLSSFGPPHATLTSWVFRPPTPTLLGSLLWPDGVLRAEQFTPSVVNRLPPASPGPWAPHLSSWGHSAI